jgi:hypothetical protein
MKEFTAEDAENDGSEGNDEEETATAVEPQMNTDARR